MRKQYILMILSICLSMGAFAQQTEYLGKMPVTPIRFEQKGDSVYVKLNLDMSEFNVDSRKSITLIPALVSSTHSFNLPSIVIKGRDSYHVYERQLSLLTKRERAVYAGKAPYAVLRGFKPQEQDSMAYQVTVKFEPWMKDARLDLYEDVCGCNNPARRTGVDVLMSGIDLEKIIVIEPYTITPHLSYVQPTVEAVKQREVRSEAFLDFLSGKTDINPDYMNNPRELKKITDMMNEIRRDEAITVKKIDVAGYASPEGSLAGNRRLSEGRGMALAAYLAPRFDYPQSMYRVEFGGENWDGLRQLVEASDKPYRQQVLDLIAAVPAQLNVKENASLKRSLMNLNKGVPYRDMLKTFFPSLRKAVCNISFEVKGFDVDEAKVVIGTRPQNLSLNEMYLVAITYTPGTQEFIDVFETAVRMFPTDETANLNAAMAALSRKDTQTAMRYLKKVMVQTAEYHNAMGVLLMIDEVYDIAEKHLQKAAESGLESAKLNLEELKKKQDNIRDLNDQDKQR